MARKNSGCSTVQLPCFQNRLVWPEISPNNRNLINLGFKSLRMNDSENQRQRIKKCRTGTSRLCYSVAVDVLNRHIDMHRPSLKGFMTDTGSHTNKKHVNQSRSFVMLTAILLLGTSDNKDIFYTLRHRQCP